MSEEVIVHEPLELDPMADIMAALAATEEQLREAEAEREKESDRRWNAEEQLKVAQHTVETLQQENTKLQCSLDQCRKQVCDQAVALKRALAIRDNARKEEKQKRIRSVMWPCIIIAIFAVLCLLVSLCVDKALMSPLLGEPLGNGCIFVCAFFAGIVWKGGRK